MSFDINCKKEDYYEAENMLLPNTGNDCGYAKCGELYVLFNSFEYVFLCFICKNHIKYEKLNDLITHLEQEHYGCQTQKNPFVPTCKITSENESDISAPDGSRNMELVPENNQSSRIDLCQEIKIEQCVDFLPYDEEIINEDDECSNQPSLNPIDKWILNSDSPFDRIFITELIDLYRKCIGLWHTKTERDTPNEVKAAAFSYLDERFSAHYPGCRQNDSFNLLTSMKNSFLKKVEKYIQDNDDKSEGWYLSHLTFFLFAHSEELGDEEFKDFNCLSCEYKADGLTRSVDLWNHIIADHLKFPKEEAEEWKPIDEEHTIEEPTTKKIKRVSPLKWPDAHILKFIELYQKHECLWNAKSRNFYNLSTKANAYADLIEQVNNIHPKALENEQTVNSVINSLRARYLSVDKHLNSISKPGKKPSVRLRWKVFEKLSFIKKTARPTSKRGVIDFTCEVCGKLCTSRKKFRTHAAKEHPNERYECGRCNLTFISQLSKKLHCILHSKSDDEPYTCSVCDEFCENSDGLEAHVKNHLTTDNPRGPMYICKYCNSKFSHRFSFNNHIQQHKLDE